VKNPARALWEWAQWHRPPLAFVSVGIKFIRQVIWLPLLWDVITYSPVTAWTYARFWFYVVIALLVWLIDSVLDADGSGS
jgi:hypothetical protein